MRHEHVIQIIYYFACQDIVMVKNVDFRVR